MKWFKRLGTYLIFHFYYWALFYSRWCVLRKMRFLKETEVGFLCSFDYISFFIAVLWFVELDLRITEIAKLSLSRLC